MMLGILTYLGDFVRIKVGKHSSTMAHMGLIDERDHLRKNGDAKFTGGLTN